MKAMYQKSMKEATLPERQKNVPRARGCPSGARGDPSFPRKIKKSTLERPRSSQGSQGSAKHTPSTPKGAQREPQGSPKDPERLPKASQKAPREPERTPKGVQKGPQGSPKNVIGLLINFFITFY